MSAQQKEMLSWADLKVLGHNRLTRAGTVADIQSPQATFMFPSPNTQTRISAATFASMFW